MADIKGDVASICNPGGNNPKIEERIKVLRFELILNIRDFLLCCGMYLAIRAILSGQQSQKWGLFYYHGCSGLMMYKAECLNIVFKVADDTGMLLIDLKDLRGMLKYVGDNAKDYTTDYGNVSIQSIGAIQRGLLTLEEQGGNNFFAEPALDILDFLKIDKDGRGFINVLASDQLFQAPALYSTFLLWLLIRIIRTITGGW